MHVVATDASPWFRDRRTTDLRPWLRKVFPSSRCEESERSELRRAFFPRIDLAIRIAPQVREHVVPLAALALRSQRGEVDRSDHDALPRSRLGLRQHAAVVVDDHAPAGPTERRIVRQ